MITKTSLPDVLHIGFSKCASTFLQGFFESHPEIFLINQSHYFSPFELGCFDKGLEWYKGLYEDVAEGQLALESDEHIVMPIFHPVLKSAATTMEAVDLMIERVIQTNPNAKIMMVVRGQVDLIASRYSEFLLCGGVGSFNDFAEEQLKSSLDGRNYYENYYYSIAEKLMQAFGEKNVFLLLQEQLRHDEDKVITGLCDFLGVSHSFPQKRDMASQRVGLSILGMKVVNTYNRLVVKECKQSHQEARTRIPFILYKIFLRLYRYIDYWLPDKIKGDKSTLVTPAIRERIHAVFESDNRKLAQLLGLDLSEYGYY